MPNQQTGSLHVPVKGEPLKDTIHSAYWLGKLVAAATGRTTIGSDSRHYDPHIMLANASLTLPVFSVVGAIGATYAAPTYEPAPYLKAHLGRSQLTFYTKYACTATNGFITGYPFLPGVPVRVRVDPATSYYVTGMPVGRLAGSSTIKSGGGGLILISLPYSADGGTTYYAWAMKDEENLWPVRYKENLPAAVQSERDPSTAKAWIDLIRTDGDLETNSQLLVSVTNRFKNISIDKGTFGEITWKQGEWRPVTSDCPSDSSESVGA